MFVLNCALEHNVLIQCTLLIKNDDSEEILTSRLLLILCSDAWIFLLPNPEWEEQEWNSINSLASLSNRLHLLALLI